VRYLKKKKVPKQLPPVLYDKQEKRPWVLPFKMKRVNLKTGDYSFEGFEDIIAIEKKSGLVELLNDLANDYRPTFERFLKRMSKYPVKCIVVEDTLSELSINRALIHIRKKSRGKARLTSRTIYYWVSNISVKYNIPIIFVGKRAKMELLPEIFRAAFEKANEL
jgi:hypothetical protein